MAKVLSSSFYRKDTTEVARRLLGCTLVHVINGRRLSGKIVETEAYLGIEDKACHSFGGKRSERLKSMYLTGGHAYVYLIYGMYNCFNVVTKTPAHPEAVLIRAIEPLEGVEFMRRQRPQARRDIDLTNGPGKLCQAMGIDRQADRLLLSSESQLYIERGDEVAPSEIIAAPRIGVDYAGAAAKWPLRFYIKHNLFVSKQLKL